MSEWIEELKRNAENDIYMSEGELKSYSPQVGYTLDQEYSDPRNIFLSGNFTIEQLQDLVTHMKKHKEKQC